MSRIVPTIGRALRETGQVCCGLIEPSRRIRAACLPAKEWRCWTSPIPRAVVCLFAAPRAGSEKQP